LDAGAFQDDRDFTAERELWTHSLSADYERNRWKLSLQQSWTQSDRYLFDDSTHVGGFAKWSEGRYEGEASITDLFGVFEFSDAFSIVSGAQFIRQQTQQSYQSISAFGLFEAIPITRKDSRTAAYSLYSSLLFESGRWNAEAGFRLNSHSIYDQQTTFTFNPSVRIQDRARVFVNVSTGYKIPSLYQLYSEYGNLSLTPESSFNIETGVQLELFDRMLDLRLVGFKRDIKDLIVFYTDENWVSFYVNRDEQNDIGFEVDSRIFLGQYLSWRNRALFVEGEGKSGGIKSKNLYRRPNVLLNSQVLVNPSQTWSLQTSFRFVGSRLKGPFDIGPDRLSSYYTLSFYGEYQLNSLVVLFADLQNSTGQKFEEVPGYSTQGRYLTVGASLRW
jgi:vitamin B12 transporter